MPDFRENAAPYASATKQYYQSMSHSSIGLQLGISVALGAGAGHWADGKLGSGPWLLLLGLAFGSFAGFRAVFRASERLARHDEAAAATAPSTPSELQP